MYIFVEFIYVGRSAPWNNEAPMKLEINTFLKRRKSHTKYKVVV